MADTKKVLIEVQIKTSGASKKLNEVGKSTENVGKSAQKATGAFYKLGKAMKQIAKGFIIVKTIQLVISALVSLVATAAQFEQAMAKVKAISGASAAQFKRLEKSARDLGKSSLFTATQVAGLQLAYSKLGFTTDEIIAASEATLDLATATGEDLANAADVVGATIRGFGLSAEETSRVVDVMAQSFTSSALNLENFKQSMKTIAPIAAAANIDLETSAALLGTLADAGLRGTRAATGLKNLMSQLSDPTSELAQKLGYTVGNSEALVVAFKDLRAMNIDLAAATGLTDERSKAAFLSIIRGVDNVVDLKHALYDASGAASNMAQIVGGTLVGSWKRFMSQVDETEIALSNSSLFESVVDTLSELLVRARDGAKAAGDFVLALEIPKAVEKSMEGVNDKLSTFAEKRKKETEELAKLNQGIAQGATDSTKAAEAIAKNTREANKKFALEDKAFAEEILNDILNEQVKVANELESLLENNYAEQKKLKQKEIDDQQELIDSKKAKNQQYGVEALEIAKLKNQYEDLVKKEKDFTNDVLGSERYNVLLGVSLELKTLNEEMTAQVKGYDKVAEQLAVINKVTNAVNWKDEIKNRILIADQIENEYDRLVALEQAYSDNIKTVQEKSGLTGIELEKAINQQKSGLEDARDNIREYVAGQEEIRRSNRITEAEILIMQGELAKGSVKLLNSLQQNLVEQLKDESLTADERVAIELQYQKDVLAAIDDFNDENDRLSAERVAAAEREAKAKLDWDKYFAKQALKSLAEIGDAAAEFLNNQIDHRQETLENAHATELRMLEANQQSQLDIYTRKQAAEIASFQGTEQQKVDFAKQKELEQTEYTQKQEELKEKFRRKQIDQQNKLGKAGFRAQKAATAASLAFSLVKELGAIRFAAASNPINSVNPFWGIAQEKVLRGLAYASHGAQLGTAMAQQYSPIQYQDGGSIVGPRHSQGGIPFAVGGSLGFEAEGGEYIMSRNTVNRIGEANLDAMNFGGFTPSIDGGAIARGDIERGVASQNSLAVQMAETLAASVVAIPVINNATDTTDVARRVQNAANMAKF